MSEPEKSDYLIIGAGIIGLAIAREINQRKPGVSITILEKESDVAAHSSGRNSGVLHAGFYYLADSLKAKFTRDGNRQMKAFCKEHHLRLNECQKVVVACNDNEVEGIFELEKRGLKNGVDVKVISSAELCDIDPNAKTHKHALYSPDTATVDPVEVNNALKNELIAKGIKIIFGESYSAKTSLNIIKTSKGRALYANHIINAAGLYADHIAQDFGFAENYTIIPFKGIYLKYTLPDKPIKTNIYPVPNLKNPFLGVHFTITVDGIIKIGPTAIPAFWRENYKGMTNFSFGELATIVGWEAVLFLGNSFGFRNLAVDEIKKYRKKYFVNLATNLVHELKTEGFTEWSKPGIRAQLLNKKTKMLVQDFVVEGDELSTHVLNAVSPAFTSSFPFAKWVVENYIN
ncbi:MAG TPA: L-2-hydroxyglutarate oxidase [Bacteroidales bacterium]|nr:MAG: FAD-dependent oxidoreductase [Bacteroidetes bacterium GWF2_35_48]HBX52118.1 L-2-hydroxyglutarate oxidase [Bacteroidales bacterium]